MSDVPSARSPEESVAALSRRLTRIPKRDNPVEWAVAAYRLGLARCEQAGGDIEANLREALGLFDQAAQVLSRERAPVEHARIVNAVGSARRMLGDLDAAVRFFAESASLMQGRGVEAEHASVLSNLGLALNEQGRTEEAIDAFDRSLDVLPRITDEDRRTLVATQHNLAQASAALGTSEGLDQAIATLDAAASTVASLEAPLHEGMVWHSLGVVWKAKATVEPDRRTAHTERAIECLRHCLGIFTSSTFPFQFAIAKHNLGHAHANFDDLDSLRLALVNYEDAALVFDPRLHQPYWTEVTANLELLDARLQAIAPGQSRADHVAALLGATDELERLALLRHRLSSMERLPDQHRVPRLGELAHAALRLPPAGFVAILKTQIMVLMELPDDMLRAALTAQVAAHARLEAHDRRAADFMLDEAIDLLLFGPQRIRVRDLLEQIGWERP